MPKELKNKPNRTRCNCGMQLLINLYVDESDKDQEPLLVKTKIRFQGYEPKTYNLNSDRNIDCPGCGTRFDWKGNRVASEGWQEHPGTFCGHFFVKK